MKKLFARLAAPALIVLLLASAPAAEAGPAWAAVVRPPAGASDVLHAQSNANFISRNAALQSALRVLPGSKPLGVDLEPDRGVYVVRLKDGSRIQQIIVDARSGAVVGR